MSNCEQTAILGLLKFCVHASSLKMTVEGLSILGGADIVSCVASSAVRMRKGEARRLTFGRASSAPFPDRDFPARDRVNS
jgi:hypothetical protein